MNNNNTFAGKVALVTGGTSGIGKATAIEFARAGAKVVVSGRREKEGAEVVSQIKKLGGDAAFIRADVAKEADVKEMVKFTVERSQTRHALREEGELNNLDTPRQVPGLRYGGSRSLGLDSGNQQLQNSKRR